MRNMKGEGVFEYCTQGRFLLFYGRKVLGERKVILHNARIYRTAQVKRVWLALCSRVARKFLLLSSINEARGGESYGKSIGLFRMSGV